MILSTQCGTLAHRFGFKDAVRILARAGFDAVDLSLYFSNQTDDFPFGKNDVTFAKELKAIAESEGVFFNQAHAPFASELLGNEEFNRTQAERIRRAIEIAGIVEVKQIIVHPVCGFSDATECIEYNVEFYNKLVPYIKNTGMKIALENMWGYDEKNRQIVPNHISFAHELISCFDKLDPEYFTVCLDIGHSALIGEDPDNAIRILGHDKLGALHVHDVDFKDDLHTLPGCSKLDWNKICSALAEIDYKGEFTFEADNFLNGFDAEFMPEASAYMCKVGRHLISKIEAAKKI